MANGYSELNDPLEQEMRFEEQDQKRKLGDMEADSRLRLYKCPWIRLAPNRRYRTRNR